MRKRRLPAPRFIIGETILLIAESLWKLFLLSRYIVSRIRSPTSLFLVGDCLLLLCNILLWLPFRFLCSILEAIRLFSFDLLLLSARVIRDETLSQEESPTFFALTKGLHRFLMTSPRRIFRAPRLTQVLEGYVDVLDELVTFLPLLLTGSILFTFYIFLFTTRAFMSTVSLHATRRRTGRPGMPVAPVHAPEFLLWIIATEEQFVAVIADLDEELITEKIPILGLQAAHQWRQKQILRSIGWFLLARVRRGITSFASSRDDG